MVSTVENSDVEVYVRTSMVGWFTIESHGKESVVMKYEEEGTGKRKRIGAEYIRPLKEVMEVDKRMNEMAKCNLIIGDLNTRNLIWGKEAGDNTTNAYGRQLQKWIEKENRSRSKTKEKTFRQISGLDITIYKTTDQPLKRSMTDKCGFEHMGQIIRIQVEKPHNLKKDNMAWKKVDWNNIEKWLKEIDTEKDGGWGGLKDIMSKLPKSKSSKKKNRWWTEDLERIAKDTRCMKRSGNEVWKTARKVLRNEMFKRRYEKMKSDLSSMKDPEIFRAIKPLECHKR